MKLLGKRNWYLPRRLGWLPRAELDVPAHGIDGIPALAAACD